MYSSKDKERREYNKQYADRKSHTKLSTIDVGGTVLVRQEKQNKFTTKFKQTPYTVINRKGSEVTARSRNNHIVRRNVSHFKKIPRSEQFDSDTDDDPDILTLDTDNHMEQMGNQHNNHAEQAEQDDQKNGLDMKFLLNF